MTLLMHPFKRVSLKGKLTCEKCFVTQKSLFVHFFSLSRSGLVNSVGDQANMWPLKAASGSREGLDK